MSGIGKPFKPGESGNPKGRPKKGETITELVKEYLRKKIPNNKDKLTYKDLFVKKVLEKAYKGDMQAIKLLWNYIDGMPKQTIQHEGQMEIEAFFNVHKELNDKQGNNEEVAEDPGTVCEGEVKNDTEPGTDTAAEGNSST